MRKCLLVFLSLLIVTGAVSAQTDTTPIGPISTLEAGEFSALAVTVDGDRLLVADAQNDQVRVYDFTDPANPQMTNSLDVGGKPVLLAGGKSYGMVAVVESGSTTDSVQVVAPAFSSPRALYLSGISYIDIPKNPVALALSPNSKWGIAAGKTGYVLMEIHAADNIDWLPVNQTLINVALSNTTAYVLHDQVLDAAPLVSGQALTAKSTLKLNGTPTYVAINPSLSEGVVVVNQTQLVFFDPKTLKQTGTFTVNGAAITGTTFLTKETSEFLLIAQAKSPRLLLLDAHDPAHVAELGSTQAMKNPIQAMTTYSQYLIVTDGTTISVFAS